MHCVRCAERSKLTQFEGRSVTALAIIRSELRWCIPACYRAVMTTPDKINLLIAIISGVSVLVSLAVCVATFQILKATRDTLSAAKEQMFAARRPYLDIAAIPGEDQPILTLVVRNGGSSAAQRVRLTIDRDFHFNGDPNGRNLRDLPLFARQVDAVPAHAEIKLLLGAGWSILGNPNHSPPQFSIMATYSFEGQVFTETSLIDLQAFEGHAVGKAPQLMALEKLVAATEKLAKQLAQNSDR